MRYPQYFVFKHLKIDNSIRTTYDNDNLHIPTYTQRVYNIS